MSVLFTPIRLRNIEIRNRLVFPAMNTRQADAEGFVTDRSISYYRERASNGVGLVTVEMCSPELAGRHRISEVGIYDDKFIPGLARLAQAIKNCGAKASIQIGHGGGHTRREVTGENPIGPSSVEHLVREKDTRRVIPTEMDQDRINKAIQSFVDAAARARQAGFDAVEIHGAHGYLIFQFLSPLDNKRTDQYGGTLRNRARFALELMEALRKGLPNFPITFRLSIGENAPNGFTADEGVQVAQWIAEAGADAIHASAGSYRSLPSGVEAVIPPMTQEPGINVPLASRVKEKVKIPVIAVGRLDDPALAERVLESGYADMIAIGRGLIADPEWPKKVSTRKTEGIRICLACNTCVETMHLGSRINCVVNPWAGREGEMVISPANESRRVLVVGGGPSGLEAARVLSVRGHKVMLVEKNPVPGGSLRSAMKAPMFQGVELNASQIEKFINYQTRAAVAAGVELQSSVSIDERLLDRFRPDIVILATGALYKFPFNLFVNLMLKSSWLGTPFFKRILKRLHQSPKLQNLFYNSLRKSHKGVLPLLKRKMVKFYTIGDCQKLGKTQDALLSAVKLAVEI